MPNTMNKPHHPRGSPEADGNGQPNKVPWPAVHVCLGVDWRQPRHHSFGPTIIRRASFCGMSTAVSLGALYMTVLILSTQRRDDELARQKEHLFLQLTFLVDQKSAKIIELLEEM